MIGQVINEPELLSDAGLAALLKVSLQTVRRFGKDPNFPQPLQVGRFRRWDKQAVLNYFREECDAADEGTPDVD